MRLRDLIIMLVIGGMFIAGVSGFISESAKTYGITNSSLSSLDTLEDAQALTNSMSTTIGLDSPKGTWDLIMSGLWNTIVLTGQSIGIFSSMFHDVFSVLGLPSWAFIGIMTLLTIFVIYEIAQIFSKGGT